MGAAQGDSAELAVHRRLAVKLKTGMGKAAYDNAVKDLIDNGYLTYVHGNTYQFRIQPVNNPSPDNQVTGSRVSVGTSPDNQVTGSRVSVGEINTINTNINTINTLGDNSFKDVNVSRGETDVIDKDTIEDVTLALMSREGKRYTRMLYNQKYNEAQRILNGMQNFLSMGNDLPLWQYLRFHSEAEYKAAAEKGKQMKDDEEIPF